MNPIIGDTLPGNFANLWIPITDRADGTMSCEGDLLDKVYRREYKQEILLNSSQHLQVIRHVSVVKGLFVLIRLGCNYYLFVQCL